MSAYILLPSVVLIALSLFSLVSSLPGLVPTDYKYGTPIGIKVVKLDSVKTQLPYDYYSLPFCKPPGFQETEASENLGEILSGDEIKSSPYVLNVQKDVKCKIVCGKLFNLDELHAFSDKIEDEYRVNWLLDNIPAVKATKKMGLPSDDDKDEDGYVTRYEKGFALGFVGTQNDAEAKVGVKYINNYLVITVMFHQEPEVEGQGQPQTSRIVGFEVTPYSVKHEFVSGKDVRSLNDQDCQDNGGNCLATCSNPMSLIKFQEVSPHDDMIEKDTQIIFTYDVHWMKSDVKWSLRWDGYLKMLDPKIHWFSIINSIMIVLFLSGMVAVIMLRVLNREIARYNAEQFTEEDQKEETGWKLIHGDVFRPPEHADWLCVLYGTGTQVLAMGLVTLFFAALGLLSPAYRGYLIMAILFVFVFMGFIAGYNSTRFYKMWMLTEWRRNTLRTALFFPGVMFSVFFILNLFVWSQKSSGAVPFGTLVALLVLWLGISVPLVYLGAYIAYSKPAMEPPVKVNSLCRMLPPDSQQAWYASPYLSILLGGILPFAAVFIEIFFIMSSVWLNQFYYVFGFLFIVFIILIITCAEITIVLCYFQLCNEDWRWWWRAYLTPGSSAVYLFLYSILYFSTRLHIVKFVSGLLFFGYMFLVSFAFFVLTGTIGFYACWLFVRKIYASIKID